MKDIAEDPLKVYQFYKARVDLGKKFAEVKPEAYEEVLQAILDFAREVGENSKKEKEDEPWEWEE